MRRQPTRSAVTLMEVLVATFILSIGLISVIAMFPVGARNMIESVKNERTAQGAHNADNLLRVSWKDWHMKPDGSLRSDQELYAYRFPLFYFDAQGIFPPPANPALPYMNQIPNADTGISHTVFIDPIGYQTQALNGVNYQNYIGGINQFIQRIPHPDAFGKQNYRMACLPDDKTFAPSGEPAVPGGQVDRGYRYNYAWMLRRPNNTVKSEAQLWVLAFDGRSYNDVAAQEVVFQNDTSAAANPNPGFYRFNDESTVNMNFSNTGVRPPLKKGSWIMVATQFTVNGVPRWFVEFSRVIAIDEPTLGQQLVLGLEQPIGYAGSPGNGQYIVIFEHLAEVFSRGVISTKTGQVW